MANDKKDGRAQADDRFQKAQRTTVVAKSHIEAERDATRKKTTRLKELRLAKEAGAGVTDPEKKPARSSEGRDKA